jgi:nucleoside phosphorylase
LTEIDVLVLVAHRLELAGFDAALALDTDEKRESSMLRGVRVTAAEVGVGMPAAAAGTARALARTKPRCAILLGSFGAYPAPASLPIGTLLVPTEIHAIDFAALEGRAALPPVMPQRGECDAALARELARSTAGTARGVLATTLAITTDDALARELGDRSGCCAENLEAVAVALACDAVHVPFAALLGCTNLVGSQGRAQWAAKHGHAARSTATALLAWLARGAPGLPAL